MKNVTKAIISVGVAGVGYEMFVNSVHVKNGTNCLNALTGIPSGILIGCAYMIAGAYIADPNFSLKRHLNLAHEK